ncbi:antichymotrypsin-2 [Orussus abietinus]|uniref:antichymotrypsin-2 n=1 Tax=Orussus abietinus TaxID=222816 RepID=UPI00062683E8|nr:antichymotrypsin-2 [Orussus abietinus]
MMRSIIFAIVAFVFFIGIEKDVLAKHECPPEINNYVKNFSTRFYQKVAESEDGNMCVSPLSVAMVMVMVLFGSDGHTAKELRKALHFSAEEKDTKEGFQKFVESTFHSKGVELQSMSNIIFSNQLSLKHEYKDLIESTFHSISQQFDYSKRKEVTKEINNWFSQKMHERVRDIVSPDCLSDSSSMLLTNAFYFKGSWDAFFNLSDTEDRAFHVNEKIVKHVPTMFTSGTFKYGKLEELNAKFIELPFKGKDMSAFIFLPKDINGLPELEKKLHKIDLQELSKNAIKKKIRLYLPKFKIESKLRLGEALKKLGLKEIFDEKADFSMIAKKALKVGKFIHKAVMELDEEGCDESESEKQHEEEKKEKEDKEEKKEEKEEKKHKDEDKEEKEEKKHKEEKEEKEEKKHKDEDKDEKEEKHKEDDKDEKDSKHEEDDSKWHNFEADHPFLVTVHNNGVPVCCSRVCNPN